MLGWRGPPGKRGTGPLLTSTSTRPGPQRPAPSAPLSALPQSNTPRSNFGPPRCSCSVTSSSLTPQPLLHLIYRYPSPLPPAYPWVHKLSCPAPVQTASNTQAARFTNTRPAWSLSDPLSFRLARLSAYSPTGHNLAFSWSQPLSESAPYIILLDIAVLLFRLSCVFATAFLVVLLSHSWRFL